jgi:hypothetical protein
LKSGWATKTNRSSKDDHSGSDDQSSAEATTIVEATTMQSDDDSESETQLAFAPKKSKKKKKVLQSSDSDSDANAQLTSAQQKSKIKKGADRAKNSDPDMRRVSQGHLSGNKRKVAAAKSPLDTAVETLQSTQTAEALHATLEANQPRLPNAETTQEAENTDGPQKPLHAGRGSQGFSRVRSHTRAGRGVRVLHGVPQSGSARMYTPGSFRAPNVLSRQRQH